MTNLHPLQIHKYDIALLTFSTDAGLSFRRSVALRWVPMKYYTHL